MPEIGERIRRWLVANSSARTDGRSGAVRWPEGELGGSSWYRHYVRLVLAPTVQFATDGGSRHLRYSWPCVGEELRLGRTVTPRCERIRSRAANYIEANEALSPKDSRMRIKICRKEAKESRLWLRLVDVNDDKSVDCGRQQLIQESTELMNIFGAILRKGKD